MKPSSVICGLAALLLGGTASAQDRMPPTVVDTIDVVAARPFPEEHLPPLVGFVQVIPTDVSAEASNDLGELLRRAAGLQIRRYGGIGSYALASIRGSDPSHVQVLINDTPISSAQDAMTNLSFFPIGLFDRVEVSRGPLASAPSGSPAGVIRLVTADQVDIDPRLRVGIGSFGMRSAAATLARRIGPVQTILAGDWMTTRGDYPYVDRRGTPWEASDDVRVHRQNNDLHQHDLLAQIRWSPRDGVGVEALGQGLWRDSGIPGTENLQTEHVADRFRRWFQSAAVTLDEVKGASLKLRAHIQRDADHYVNPEGEVGLGRADLFTQLTGTGAGLTVSHRLPRSNLSLAVTGNLARETFDSEDRLQETDLPQRKRVSQELAIELSGRTPIDRVDLFVQNRWIETEESLDELEVVALHRSISVPRIGGTLDLGRGVRAKGSRRAVRRLPSFVELFGQGGVQQGNAGLQPESGTSWDAGMELIWPDPSVSTSGLSTRLECVYFHSTVEDAIVWLQNSQRTTRPQNLERAETAGIETVVQTKRRPRSLQSRLLDPSVSLSVTHTFLEARDRGPAARYSGKRLPHLPKHHLFSETRAEFGRLGIAHRFEYESGVYRDRYNSQTAYRSPVTVHDLEVGYWFIMDLLDITIVVQNLGNDQIQDMIGFPLPGRSYILQATYIVR